MVRERGPLGRGLLRARVRSRDGRDGTGRGEARRDGTGHVRVEEMASERRDGGQVERGNWAIQRDALNLSMA